MLKLQLIGNLGQDATVNNVNGKSVINFSVAHTERFKAQGGDMIDKTTWVSCSYWTDKTAIVPYLKKGTQVFVEGTPEANTYVKNGQTLPTLKLRVASIQLVGGNKQSNTEQNQPQPQEAADITEPLDSLPF